MGVIHRCLFRSKHLPFLVDVTEVVLVWEIDKFNAEMHKCISKFYYKETKQKIHTIVSSCF